MSDKLFVRRRMLAFLMVFLLVFSAIILLPAFSVDAETDEEYVVASSGEISNEVALASGLSDIPPEYRNKCVEMTDSDEFEHKGTKYSIKDYPTISYVGAESKSRTLEPRIGTTVGVWAGGTLIPIGYGTVNKGTLKTVTWWEGLKKKSHNQAAYVGNIYGQKTF